jgi:O-antigen/teichoic acid export membrane protein
MSMDHRIVKSLFARQIGSTALTQGITLAAYMATTIVVARQLGPEGKGSVSLILLLPGMLQLVLGMGLNTANIYYAGSNRLPVRRLTQNAVSFLLLSAIAGFAITIVLSYGPILQFLLPGLSTGYLWLGMIMLPLALASGMFSAVLQGLQRIFTLNVLTVLQMALGLALTVVLVVWLESGIAGAVLATVVAQAVFLALVIRCLVSEGASLRPRWNPEVVRPTLAYGVKGYVGNLLQFFTYRLDVFIVNFFLGPASVGLYAVSVAFAELLWQLPNAAGYVIFPKAANSSSRTMNSITPRVFWGILALSIVGAIGLAVFGKPAIRVLFSAGFLPAYPALLILLPGVVLLGTAKILTNDIAGRGYPHYNSITSAISLIATVALDFVLVPTRGIVGAALASTLAYSLTFAVSVVFYVLVSRRVEASGAGTSRDAQVTSYGM